MIKIITTGGTIEGLDYENEKNRQIARMSIVDILEAANVSFKYKITEAFCKDSRLITIKDRIQLVSKIETSKEEKILITHGTITMLETAALLGQERKRTAMLLLTWDMQFALYGHWRRVSILL